MSDEFSKQTRRILAERAGQRCSNPDCGRSTAGPSDYQSGESTRLGKAAHITAARKGGPRYDPRLTSAERCSADNGIWLCAECADRVDKSGNVDQYPVELLRHWKEFHESTTGTDHASRRNRATYPIRQLILHDFAGVRGEVAIRFGALTIVRGASKLNQTITELLRIFAERETFERTRQPRSVPQSIATCASAKKDSWPSGSASVPQPRYFRGTGKIRLRLSDDREFVVCATTEDVGISVGDAPLPVFAPVINVVFIGEHFHRTVFGNPSSDQRPETIEGLALFFRISVPELIACIEGVPTDSSIFGFTYEIEANTELRVRIGESSHFAPLAALSGGEIDRVVLDLAARIATHAAKVRQTVLAIDQGHVSTLDERGWGVLFEWVERSRPPFQVVADLWYSRSQGDLFRAMCYEAVGTDMAVTSFRQVTWSEFKKG